MAFLLRKKGWKTFFAGPFSRGFALGAKVFDRLYEVPWNRYARLGVPPYFHWIKRKMRRILDNVKPDIIHAHNIFSAKVISDLGYPFVFDDHELNSIKKKSDIQWERSGIIDKSAGTYETWRWGRWEYEVSAKAPVITVSDSIAEFYSEHGANAFVVPNYPSLFEKSNTRLSKQKSDVFTAVYLGNDVSACCRPYRDVRGITEVFKELGVRLVVIGDVKLSSDGIICSIGYLPHLRLYSVMSTYHVGLLPWKKHWFHAYANPNKPYTYAHSAMVVIATSSLKNVIEAFNGKARTIGDYCDLKELLSDLLQDASSVAKEGKSNMVFAEENLIFERYEAKVTKAYRDAV